MRFEVVIEDGIADVSTPWQASVIEVDPDTERMTGQVQGIGYGSTPQAAAQAAIDSWRESNTWREAASNA